MFSYKFCKIHRKTPVPETFLNEIAGLRLATLFKKSLWHECFPVNFTKFLRTSIFTEQPPAAASAYLSLFACFNN